MNQGHDYKMETFDNWSIQESYKLSHDMSEIIEELKALRSFVARIATSSGRFNIEHQTHIRMTAKTLCVKYKIENE
jgi:hypothetical protein